MNLIHDETYRFVEALLHQQRALGTAASSRLRALKRIETVLTRPLRLGLFGETGSGKTLLLNILLRNDVFQAGTLGALRPLTLMRFGPDKIAYSINPNGTRHRLTWPAMRQATRGELRTSHEDAQIIYRENNIWNRSNGKSQDGGSDKKNTSIEFVEVYYDQPFLQRLEVLEVPGNFRDAIPREMPLRALTRVDLAIWTTSAAQAWKKSEVDLWQRLKPACSDRSILVVNHKETLRTPQDKASLTTRLDRETGSSFGRRVLVSLKEAFQALPQNGLAHDLEQTGISELEKTLQNVVRDVRNERLEKAKTMI